ncbi:MAG TPA: hypothetical protein VGS96_00850 [Thermoanaerobaculia bacterium]|nr:hypothetical protein [Thermoanaerobaculia bacterium]
MKLSLAVVLVFACIGMTAVPLYAQTPIVIDGQFDKLEWISATQHSFTVNLPGGGTTNGELYVTNDAANLYFCVRIQESFISPAETAIISLDANGDGILSVGDDEIVVSTGGYCWSQKQFADTVRYNPGKSCPSGLCSALDTALGGTSDGNGAVGSDGVWTTYEIWHPRAGADFMNDVQWPKAGEVVGIAVSAALLDANNNGVWTFYPAPFLFTTYTIQ